MADRVEYELVIDDRGAISTAKRFGDAVKAMSDPGPVDKQAAAFQRLMARLEPARAAAERMAQEQKLLDRAYLDGALKLDQYMAAGQKLRAEQTAGVQVQAQQAQGIMATAGAFVAAQVSIQAVTGLMRSLFGVMKEGLLATAEEERQVRAVGYVLQNLGMDTRAASDAIEARSQAMKQLGVDDDQTRQSMLHLVAVTKDLRLATEASNIAQSISYTGLMDAQAAESMVAGLLLGRTRELKVAGKDLGITVDQNRTDAEQAAEAYSKLAERYNFTASQMQDTKATVDAAGIAWADFKKGFGGESLKMFVDAAAGLTAIGVSAEALGAYAARVTIPLVGLVEHLRDVRDIAAGSLPGQIAALFGAVSGGLQSQVTYTDRTIGRLQVMTEAQKEAYRAELVERANKAIEENAKAQEKAASAATQAASAQAQLLATYNPTHAQVIKLAEDEGKLNEIVRKGGEDAYWASAALESLYEARRKLFTIADEAMPVIDIKRPEMPVTAGVEGVPMDTSAQQAFVDNAKQQAAYTQALTDAQAFMDQMGMTFAGGFAGLVLQWDQYNAQVEAGQMTSAQAITLKWSSVLAFLGGIMGQVAAGMNVQSKADFERQKNLQKASVAMSAGSAIMSAWSGAFASTPFPPAAVAIATVMTALILAQSAMRISQINAQQFTPPAAKGFETGTPYVPKTGLYQLHEGEKVVPRSVAAQRWGDRDTRSLGGQTNYNLDFSGAVLLDHDVVNKIGGMIEEQVERGHLRRAG